MCYIISQSLLYLQVTANAGSNGWVEYRKYGTAEEASITIPLQASIVEIMNADKGSSTKSRAKLSKCPQKHEQSCISDSLKDRGQIRQKNLKFRNKFTKSII